jgi:cytochrome c-type biogenesis protein
VIDERALLLAFSTGMVATVNPCGFAMLPAYLSYFLGLDDRSTSPKAGVIRALTVGLSVSAGFLTVFLLLGIPFAGLARAPWFASNLPWVTAAIGVVLVVVGVAMVRGFEPTVALPKLERGTGNRELPTMFLFGVSYAVSSLSCTIALFMGVVAGSLTGRDILGGLSAFLAYGLGMALVLMALTLTTALARQGLVRLLRRVVPHVNRIAGALLVAAGAYLTYFGWYEHQRLNGRPAPGPGRIVSDWNNSLLTWIKVTGAPRIGLLLLAAIVLTVLVATGWRSGTGAGRPRRSRG